MSAYEKVLLARAKDRPTGLSYIENIFEDFIELHGDRRLPTTRPLWGHCHPEGPARHRHRH